MTEHPPTTSIVRSWLVNLALVATAFGSVGLVLWQNREKIRTVFSHPLDLRLLVLGVVIFQISLIITYLSGGICWSG